MESTERSYISLLKSANECLELSPVYLCMHTRLNVYDSVSKSVRIIDILSVNFVFDGKARFSMMTKMSEDI